MPVEAKVIATLLGGAVLTAALVGCGSTASPDEGSTSTPKTASTGRSQAAVATIIGRYVVRPSPHLPPRGLGKREIGLFASSREPGASLLGRAQPKTTTMTGPDGRFTFTGVPPGWWVVAPMGATFPATRVHSAPLRVTETAGATVTLVGCYECFSQGRHAGTLLR
jgi:hypothetical protein